MLCQQPVPGMEDLWVHEAKPGFGMRFFWANTSAKMLAQQCVILQHRLDDAAGGRALHIKFSPDYFRELQEAFVALDCNACRISLLLLPDYHLRRTSWEICHVLLPGNQAVDILITGCLSQVF